MTLPTQPPGGQPAATQLAFIGVGNMGGRMAKRLLTAGYPLSVYDTSNKAVAQMEGLGAQRAASPADAARNAEVIPTSLPSPSSVDEVVNGGEGILSAVQPEAVLIEMSTIGPAAVRKIAAQIDTQGVRMIEAPVSRGVMAAENGTLSIMDAGVWTRDIGRSHRVAKALQAGLIWINTYRCHHPTMPFGGTGISGYGRENGLEGLHEYTQVKSVLGPAADQVARFRRYPGWSGGVRLFDPFRGGSLVHIDNA